MPTKGSQHERLLGVYITTMKWIRASRLSIKNSLSLYTAREVSDGMCNESAQIGGRLAHGLQNTPYRGTSL